jgi:hypothetical protein
MDILETTALNKDAVHSNIVRVTIPAKVAYNLDAMRRVTDSILDRLGCSNCHSGHDIRFDIERHFVVDEKLNVRTETEQFR